MKILSKDMKRNIVKVMIENDDDLWHLDKLVSEGDIVRGETSRKTDYGERKPVTLSVEVEETEFHPFGEMLRIKGKIIGAPDISAMKLTGYHTINIKAGMPVSVVKEWKERDFDRIKKAGVKKPRALAVVLDRGNAVFALIGESGIKTLGTISKMIGKDAESDKRETEFYSEVIKSLKENEQEKMIIAGPGFAKERLMKMLSEKEPGLFKKTVSETVSSATMQGISELIRRGTLKRIMKSDRITEETDAIEEFLSEIGKDGKAVYGTDETGKAVSAGAVERLMVSDRLARENGELMDLAEKLGAKITIISSDHEAGEKFLSLGGVGAFLRFRM